MFKIINLNSLKDIYTQLEGQETDSITLPFSDPYLSLSKTVIDKYISDNVEFAKGQEIYSMFSPMTNPYLDLLIASIDLNITGSGEFGTCQEPNFHIFNFKLNKIDNTVIVKMYFGLEDEVYTSFNSNNKVLLGHTKISLIDFNNEVKTFFKEFIEELKRDKSSQDLFEYPEILKKHIEFIEIIKINEPPKRKKFLGLF